MNSKLKTLLNTVSKIELEIEDQEFEINIEEILNLNEEFENDLRDVHNKVAFLKSIEALARYKVRDKQSQLALFEAEADQSIRSTGGRRIPETGIMSLVRTEPEWINKRRDINLARKELEIIEGLVEALQAGINSSYIRLLRRVSSKIAKVNLSQEEVVGMAVDRLAKRKSNKIKDEKKNKPIYKEKENVFSKKRGQQVHGEEEVEDTEIDQEEEDE